MARPFDYVTRAEMAKMISVYAMKFLGKVPDLTKDGCYRFGDISSSPEELQKYMMLSCQLGLMGLHGDGIGVLPNFQPNSWLMREEAGTILSRMLRGTKYAQ